EITRLISSLIEARHAFFWAIALYIRVFGVTILTLPAYILLAMLNSTSHASRLLPLDHNLLSTKSSSPKNINNKESLHE
ncbi:hypothetical protein PS015_23855, partial [Shigella sonnei]|nr:hypothetical protein [Shigella sonnei]